ncbi:MAG: hypothetical protein A3D26_02000 [Candidatus Blackburnbacteria bacterium RIFCSPHIGHO2_02_FULL_44_20]|uniref:Glycosyl transferase family 1 domain-containing protein n=1 Tax=Candidatus Blackburnbacteria bacterium RIFCSPHIGHO2_02_FULL_44_20 TaxID=1797516 RepID=A0A1G1V6V8_9BACT|nr:MAG: hypothetical protein A3D26_02000 [Candidatus Blackburnbacteria bacterium RIFCSPHIGHO2_02_FULL_44_20]
MNKYQKGLLKKYNLETSILVIASYPPRGGVYTSKTGGGLAPFTKNTITAISDYQRTTPTDGKIIVLAETLGREEIYEEGNVLVWRVFKRNSIVLYKQLFGAVSQFSKVRNILIEFEFNCYGDFFIASFFPFFISLLRIFNKNITLVLHQVIFDLSQLSGHLGFKGKSMKISIFNALIRLYYWFIASVSNNIITLEEEHKNRLAKLISEEKITAVPHGVDLNFKATSKSKARKKLGYRDDELVLLYFGFLTWYKGADFLVNTFAKRQYKIAGKRVRVILAGGDSPTLSSKPHYQDYIGKLRTKAEGSNTVSITGFVPQEDIPLYFAASDLVLFPYRTFMSSSGPLSLALSHKKPFLLSSSLKGYFLSPDFSSSLDQCGLREKDVLFSLRPTSLLKKVNALCSDFGYFNKLSAFSAQVAARRYFEVLVPNYLAVIGARQRSESLFSAGAFMRRLLAVK